MFPFQFPYSVHAERRQLSLPTWQVEDFVSIFASFLHNVGLTHHNFHDYVLASHTLVSDVSYLRLINDECMQPVSEPQSRVCGSPTYMPLNQIGKADKPYLHSSVAGVITISESSPHALMESWEIT